MMMAFCPGGDGEDKGDSLKSMAIGLKDPC